MCAWKRAIWRTVPGVRTFAGLLRTPPMLGDSFRKRLGSTRRFWEWRGEVYPSRAIRHCVDEGPAIQGRAFPTRRAGPHRPGGTFDNSPAFQRWDTRRSIILPSPGGTTETLSEKAFQPSLRDWTGRAGRAFPTTEVLGYCQMSLRDVKAIYPLQIGGLHTSRDSRLSHPEFTEPCRQPVQRFRSSPE